jgi:hypothetical protein
LVPGVREKIKAWRDGGYKGISGVRGTTLPAGTVIATFDTNGRYSDRVDGSSHAACYMDQTEDRLRVIDQWQGHPVAPRQIHFRGGAGRAVNDGDQFFVVEIADTAGDPPEAA